MAVNRLLHAMTALYVLHYMLSDKRASGPAAIQAYDAILRWQLLPDDHKKNDVARKQRLPGKTRGMWYLEFVLQSQFYTNSVCFIHLIVRKAFWWLHRWPRGLEMAIVVLCSNADEMRAKSRGGGLVPVILARTS